MPPPSLSPAPADVFRTNSPAAERITAVIVVFHGEHRAVSGEALSTELRFGSTFVRRTNLDAADTHALLAELHRHFVSKKVVVLADGDGGQQFFARQVPFFHDLAANGGAATAFVCENYVCQLPTPSVAKFAELLAARNPPAGKPDK